MSHRVCPWWIGYLLACPLRRFMQDPAKLLAPYVRPGMTVFEPGPGMGFFTLDLARLVGSTGHVITVDIQPKMISALKRRVAKAGLLARVDLRLAAPESMSIDDLAGKVDFTLAFALVHEMPSVQNFFKEVTCVSKSGGTVLLVEPAGHVSAEAFDAEIQAATQAGLTVVERPTIKRSHAAVFRKA
jgi:ubiquinone/menaquinone biosynthesis C-methylase UbiE